MEWKKARKKPIIVEFREPVSDQNIKIQTELREITTKGELVKTLEGNMLAIKGIHYIIRGIEGELYPIDKEIFNKTYDIIEE